MPYSLYLREGVCIFPVIHESRTSCCNLCEQESGFIFVFYFADETRVKEFGLKAMWRSPNGTIRNILNGSM